MKTTKCPAKEKKLRQEKGRKRGGGKVMKMWEAFEMF